MKTISLSVGLIFVSLFTQAQIVNIPDPNFKNALINTNCIDTNGDGIFDSDADTNNDGEIQLSEAEAVLRLKVDNQLINSLEGIESFTYLVYLNCDGNFLTNLNLTTAPNLIELNISGNHLTSFDIFENQNLEIFEAYQNNLVALDVTQNAKLKRIQCADNDILNLDVTQNPNLEVLIFTRNNLSSIDISQNLNLVHLGCTGNPLGSIDVTNNLNLTGIECQDNGLTTLDLSQNPNLDYLVCRWNNLTELDLSLNPNLSVLQIDNNLLTSLDLSQNPLLYSFTFSNNILRNLDLSQNPNLGWLIGNNNQLRNFNIQNGNNESLNYMKVQGNLGLECIQVDDEGYANNKTCNGDGWCKDSTASYSEFCELVGIEDFAVVDFQLFPNPTQNMLNIQSTIPFENVKIYSPQGILVKESATNIFDVSQLSAGIYFVEVTVDGRRATKKFIKM